MFSSCLLGSSLSFFHWSIVGFCTFTFLLQGDNLTSLDDDVRTGITCVLHLSSVNSLVSIFCSKASVCHELFVYLAGFITYASLYVKFVQSYFVCIFSGVFVSALGESLVCNFFTLMFLRDFYHSRLFPPVSMINSGVLVLGQVSLLSDLHVCRVRTTHASSTQIFVRVSAAA